MKNFWLYSAISLAIILAEQPAVAQKRKKPDVETLAGSRLREAEFQFTEAEKHFILEDYAKALVYYERSLEIVPGNATVNYKIAEVLSRSNQQTDLERAAIHIEKALAVEKKNKYFYLLAAAIQNNLTHFSQAAGFYEAMIREVPGTESYLTELAVIYQYANDQQSAIGCYERAEQVFGVSEEYSLQKISLLLSLSRTKEAIAESGKLVAHYPDDEEIVLEVCDLLLKSGNLQEAKKIQEQFILENKESDQIKLQLGMTLLQLGQESKARDLFREIFAKPTPDPSGKMIVLGTLNNQINYARSNGQIDGEKERFAVELLELLKLSYPSNQMVQILGGDLYLSTQAYPEAIQYYKAAVEGEPVNYEVWENLILLERRLNRMDELIKDCERALEYYPNQGSLYYHLAYAQMRKQNFDEIPDLVRQAQRLIRNDPDKQSDLFWILGEAYNGLGQFENSDKAFEQALVLKSNNVLAINSYCYYLAIRNSNLERALILAEKLIKEDPLNASFQDTYGWVLYKLKRYKDAIKVFQKIIENGKASSIHHEHYGDVLFKSGNSAEALVQWEKANSLSPGNAGLIRKIQNKTLYE